MEQATYALLLVAVVCCATHCPLTLAHKYLSSTARPRLDASFPGRPPTLDQQGGPSHVRIHGPQDTLAFTEPKPPSVLEVTPYQSVTLVCEAAIVEGAAPLVHWFHDGRPLSFAALPRENSNATSPSNWLMTDAPGAQVVSSTTRSVLPLSCITAAQTGFYVCVAETAALRIETTTRLLLAPSGRGPGAGGAGSSVLEMVWQRECQLEKGLQLASAVPRIVMWSKNLLQHTQQTARLFCRSTGTPRPTVTWHFTPARLNSTGSPHHKQPIASDRGKYQVLPLGDLLVNDLGVQRDMGYYICRVKNHFGSDHAAAFLYPLRTDSTP